DFNNAFFWDTPTGLTDLGHLPGSSVTIPRAVNNATAAHPVQVVGEAWLTPNPAHAFLWQGNVLTDLNDPTLYPSVAATGWILTSGYGINDNQQVGMNNASQAQVVGQTVDANANVQARAVLWQGNTVAELTKQIPAGAGWSNLSNATGVNDAGLIVGSGALASGVGRAFLLTPV